MTDSISISVNENDEAGFELTPASGALVLTEGAGAKTFTVKLASQPERSVEVRVAASGSSGVLTIDTDTNNENGNQNSLIFSPNAGSRYWKTARSVSVTPADDADADDVESLTVTLSVGLSGDDYADQTASVDVSIVDDDEADLQLSETEIALSEDGSSEDFTVRLATRPSGNVTVSASSTDTAAARLSSAASLTFTPSNWSTAQTLTVRPVSDSDAGDETVVVNLSASGGGYAGVKDSVSVTVDDDDAAGLTTSTPTLTLTENAPRNFGSFTLQLTTQPQAPVLVSLSSSQTGAVAAAPSSLTFTASNWNVQQTVTVVAFSDSDVSDETVTLDIGASGGGYGGVKSSVTVTVADHDNTGLELSSSSLALNEGASGSFSVKLLSQPSGDVAVNMTNSNASAATVTPNRLSFTARDWNAPQSVTVTSVDDDDSTDARAVINLQASGGNYQNVSDSVKVEVADDDLPALSLSRTSVSMAEGTTERFTAALTARPTQAVTVSLTSSASGTATVTPASLSFTTGNWNTPRTVTLNAPHDEDAVDAGATVTLSASGGNYQGKAGSVAVSVKDDETAGLTLSASLLRLTEGDRGSFSVSLMSRPGRRCERHADAACQQQRH